MARLEADIRRPDEAARASPGSAEEELGGTREVEERLCSARARMSTSDVLASRVANGRPLGTMESDHATQGVGQGGRSSGRLKYTEQQDVR